MCVEPDCNASAWFKTDKCMSHGCGKRFPNWIEWIDSRCCLSDYNWYCATYFSSVTTQWGIPDNLQCNNKLFQKIFSHDIRISRIVNEENVELIEIINNKIVLLIFDIYNVK